MRLVADDLSGAAEAAGVLLRNGIPATVLLDPDTTASSATILDLHVRNAGADASARIHLGIGDRDTVDYVKIDSQLRGPVAMLVHAASTHSAVVLAPALPRLQRTVHRGVVMIDGAPLHTSAGSAWRTEAVRAPRRLLDVVPATLPAHLFSVNALRSGDFARELHRARPGQILIPDTHSPADLRVVASALADAPRTVTPIGSAGLLEAMVGQTTSTHHDAPLDIGTTRKLVIVLGSLEPVVAAQHAAIALDATTVRVQPWIEPIALAALIRDALERPERAVIVATHPSDGAHDVAVAERVGRAVADVVASDPEIALALIGGETARRTLHAVGETALTVLGEIHPGAVLCTGAGGRRVVTRPGSFGGVDSLHQIATTLLGHASRVRQEEGIQ